MLGAHSEDLQADFSQEVELAREDLTKLGQQMAGRGDALNGLQDKTDRLAHSAQDFRRGANQVRKKMWWKVSEPVASYLLAGV